MKKPIIFLFFALIIFNIDFSQAALSKNYEYADAFTPTTSSDSQSISNWQDYSAVDRVGVCSADSQICDCTKLWCNGYQATAFLLNWANDTIYRNNSVTAFGIEKTETIDRMYIYGSFPVTKRTFDKSLIAGQLGKVDGLILTESVIGMHPFTGKPSFFDVTLGKNQKFADYETFETTLSIGQAYLDGDGFADLLDGKTSSLTGMKKFKNVEIHYYDTASIAFQKAISTPKNYIALKMDFDNVETDFSLQVARDAKLTSGFVETCARSLQNYLNMGISASEYCKNVFDASLQEQIKQAILNANTQSLNNISQTVSAPSTGVVSQPVSDLQEKINDDVQKYYECFIDSSKCGYVQSQKISGYRDFASEFGGKCSSTLARDDAYANVISQKSSTPELSSRANELPSMNPNLAKGIISVESNWKETALNKEGETNPLNYSYGLMQVSGTNLKIGPPISGLPDYYGTGPRNEDDISWVGFKPENNIARGATVYRYYNYRLNASTACQTDKEKVLPNLDDVQVKWPGVLAVGGYNAGLSNVSCEDGGRITNDKSPRTTQHTIAVLAWSKIFQQNDCVIRFASEVTPGVLKADLGATKDTFFVGEPLEIDASSSQPDDGRRIAQYEASAQGKPSSAGEVAPKISTSPRIVLVPELRDSDVGDWEIKLEVAQDNGETDETTKTVRVVPRTAEEAETSIPQCEDASGNANCTSIMQCLACIDGRFVKGVFKTG